MTDRLRCTVTIDGREVSNPRVIEGVIVARDGVRVCDHAETDVELLPHGRGPKGEQLFDRRVRCLRCRQVVAGVPDREQIS